MSLALDGTRCSGQEVRNELVSAAVSVANIVKTSLGPIGMDKMIVDEVGDFLVTNDGATILKRLDVTHPAAKLLVELAQMQDEEVGDGTTSVTIIAAELLKRANQLVQQHVHPTTIILGYRLAMKAAVKFIESTLAKDSDSLGTNVLLNVAKTSMSSKVIGLESAHFSKIVVDAITSVRTINDIGDYVYNVKAINILKQHGASARESALVDGFALPCARAGQGMPTRVDNAKIALLDFDLRIAKMKMGVQIVITEASKVEALRDRETTITRDRVMAVINAGANVIATTGGIDDTIMKYLVENGVLGIRRMSKADLKRLAKATGGIVLHSLADLEGTEKVSATSFGSCDVVSEERFADDEAIVFRDGGAKTNSSIILRGANGFMLDEMERSVHDALMAVKRVLESPAVVAGGGAVEAALHLHLDDYSRMLASREQLAVAEFAEAVLTIPKQLAINAGLDAVDACARVVVAAAKDKNGGMGLDLTTGDVVDHFADGILEPAMSKVKQIKLATEAAITVLRIDEMIKLNPTEPVDPRGGH